MYFKFQLYQQGSKTRNAMLRSHFEFCTPLKGQFLLNDATYTLGLQDVHIKVDGGHFG
jgi:hypothetical protein